MITGRVVDARTGKGIAGLRLQSLRLDQGKNNWMIGEATTDTDGRYRVPARPGKILIEPTEVPKTHLALVYGEYPRLEVKADQTWPDLKLAPATTIDGIVVNESGQPAPGAEVFLLAHDPTRLNRPEPLRAGPDGAFQFGQLDPDDRVSLWAALRKRDDRRGGCGAARGGQGQGQADDRPEARRPDPRHGHRRPRQENRGGQGDPVVDPDVRQQQGPGRRGGDRQRADDGHDPRQRLVRLPGALAGPVLPD